MSSKTKKVLTVAAIAFSGFLLFSFKKLNTAQEVMNNIKVGIKNIANLKLSWQEISFNTVFTLQNLTNIDFGATLTSKIIIKQIRVYSDTGVYLGKADTNIYQLDLPSKQIVELPEAKFTLDINKAFDEFISNADAYLSQDFSKLKFKIDIEVFGNIITLEP